MTEPGARLAGVPLGPASVRGVRTERLRRWYGRVDALSAVSLTFPAGACSVILGPNGAGKSTLLRLLATLDAPSEGRVLFGDGLDSVRDRARVRARIGLVGHESLLYHDLTGLENLVFFADLQGVPRTDASAWLERVDLADAADKRVADYSRGMRQRLSIARALLHHPDVVLLDEPLTGLDRTAQDFLWALISWLKGQGRTVIVVTHQFDAPTGLVDRVVVLDRGRVRYESTGTPDLAEAWARGTTRGRA